MAFSHRDMNGSGFTSRALTQGIKKGDSLTVSLAGGEMKSRDAFNVEIAGKIGPVHAQAEANQRDSSIENGADSKTFGWYAQTGWFITGESRRYKQGIWEKVKPNNNGAGAWELFARVEGLDFDDDGISANSRNKGNIYVVGLNWYPNEVIRVSANYVQSNWDEALANGDGKLVRADSLTGVSASDDVGRGFAVRMQASF